MINDVLAAAATAARVNQINNKINPLHLPSAVSRHQKHSDPLQCWRRGHNAVRADREQASAEEQRRRPHFSDT